MKRKGWKKLGDNEIIQKGDEFYASDPLGDPPRWHKSLSVGYRPRDSVYGYVYFRRRK